MPLSSSEKIDNFRKTCACPSTLPQKPNKTQKKRLVSASANDSDIVGRVAPFLAVIRSKTPVNTPIIQNSDIAKILNHAL